MDRSQLPSVPLSRRRARASGDDPFTPPDGPFGDGRSSAAGGSALRGSRLALCLWLPTFELRLELARRPSLGATSVGLLSPGEGPRRTVWQLSERAGEAGVRPGMPVSRAVGLCPGLTLLEPDPTHYDAAMEGMLEALAGMSPVVEPAGRGRIFVGVDGLGRLYGSPPRQAEAALRALAPLLPRHLTAAFRAGRAPGKFAAWVAAVTSRPGKPRIVPEEELAAFLSPRPVAALPVEADILERLRRLGMGTLGEVASLSEAGLAAHFGDEGRRARAWARGERIDPVRPWHRPEPIVVSIDFPSPVGREDALAGAVDRLADRALSRPARRGRSVRGARLRARLEGGGSWSLEAVPREPTGEGKRLAFVLRSRMEASPPPRAVASLSLELFDFGAATRQPELFGRREEGGGEEGGRKPLDGDPPEALKEAVRELKLKLGFSPLYRVVEVDPWSRIPERRHALLSYDP